MINEGTHDYGRDPFSLPDDMDPRARHVLDRICVEDHAGCYMHAPKANTEAQRAQARQATVPTLGELVAANAMNMVTTEAGASMPAKLAARGDDGWEFDSDRDSEKAARLAGLVKDMDRMVGRYNAGQDSDTFLAAQMASLWQAIRKITQGSQS